MYKLNIIIIFHILIFNCLLKYKIGNNLSFVLSFWVSKQSYTTITRRWEEQISVSWYQKILAIREIYVETNLSFHFTPARMSKTKKKEQINKTSDDNGKYGCEERRTLIRHGGHTNGTTTWKSLWGFLKRYK